MISVAINRNLWLSIVLALPAVMALYVLTNISYFTVMDKATLLNSNAVAIVNKTPTLFMKNYTIYFDCLDMG